MATNEPTITTKIAMIGDSDVGKSTLLTRYIENKFEEEFIDTLGFGIMEHSVQLKNCIANLVIYDIPSPRIMSKWIPDAMKDSKAVIFLFDITRKSSLMSIKRWYKDCRKHNKSFIPILVGTKWDLINQKLTVKDSNEYETSWSYYCDITRMARRYAAAMKSGLVYTSTKDALNVKTVFNLCIAKVFKIGMETKENSFDHSQPIREWNVRDVIYNCIDRKVNICVVGYLRVYIEPLVNDKIIPMELPPIIVEYAKSVVESPLFPEVRAKKNKRVKGRKRK